MPERILRWLPELQNAADKCKVDLHILAAVLDRESLGGEALWPKGPTGTGDFGKPGTVHFRDRKKGELGHGRGLMQIDDRAHIGWLELKDAQGTPLWQKPADNILKGATILAQGVAILGCVEGGIAAYNAGPFRAKSVVRSVGWDAPSDKLIAALDKITTGGDYVSAVLKRAANFKREK